MAWLLTLQSADSKTRRHHDLLASRLEWLRRHARAQSLGYHETFIGRRLGQHGRELFTADAGEPIEPEPEAVVQTIAELAQYVIADRVPMIVVDALK